MPDNPKGIDDHKSIDWNEIKPRTSCQPPVTDNGEAVPTPKEMTRKTRGRYPPLPRRSPRLHLPRDGHRRRDHPTRRLYSLRRGLRRATQRLLEHPLPLQRQGAGRGDRALLLRRPLPQSEGYPLVECGPNVQEVYGDDAV